ncbi:MAG: YkgB family protein [Longimicrobiales bacterium]
MRSRTETLGGFVLRYGLVAVIFWIGLFKFTQTEADAIVPLLTNSPLLNWLYDVLDVRNASRAIGVAEVLIAILIAVRPLWPALSALGSLGAVAMFGTTLSFLATTPGMFVVVEGLLVPSGMGSFVIKDVVLLGAALWTVGEALAAARLRRQAAGADATT